MSGWGTFSVEGGGAGNSYIRPSYHGNESLKGEKDLQINLTYRGRQNFKRDEGCVSGANRVKK